MKFLIIHPETQFVTDSDLIVWANDYLVNVGAQALRETPILEVLYWSAVGSDRMIVRDLPEALHILGDSGAVTFGNGGRPVLRV